MRKVSFSLALLAAALLADGPVLKTGQTTVYKQGDDGTYQAGLARSYTRNAAGVVKDNATGLEWQDDYSDNNGTIKQANWADAKTYCENLTLDGKSDWRLPSLKELRTLVDRGRTDPAVDPTFINTASRDYWSSTTSAGGTTVAWDVSFYGGDGGIDRKTYSCYVRCVRSGQ